MLGSAGLNGGNYNAAISNCSPSTSIVNYTDGTVFNNSTGTTDHVAITRHIKTVNGCSNIATISFNQAPDIIAKVALDPGWGHYELFGIAGFAHETIYPGETTNSTLRRKRRRTCRPDGHHRGRSSSSGYRAGGSGSHHSRLLQKQHQVRWLRRQPRVPVIKDKLTFGAKGLYGPGVGRYGDSTLADVTANALGKLAPIHNLSGLFTVEATPTPKLVIYLNYGGDYAGRNDFGTGSTIASSLGAPTAYLCPIGYTTANG